MLTEIYQNVSLIGIFILQSPLICVRCPSYRGVRFIESFNVGNPTKNGRDQTTCPSLKGVRLTEVFVKVDRKDHF